MGPRAIRLIQTGMSHPNRETSASTKVASTKPNAHGPIDLDTGPDTVVVGCKLLEVVEGEHKDSLECSWFSYPSTASEGTLPPTDLLNDAISLNAMVLIARCRLHPVVWVDCTPILHRKGQF